MHLTGGYAPHFQAFCLAPASSVKMALSRPSRQQVTQAVRRRVKKLGQLPKSMLSTSPSPGAHPAQSRSISLRLDRKRGVCFMKVRSFWLVRTCGTRLFENMKAIIPVPQLLHDKMVKGVRQIQQPAPNNACSRQVGVIAFSSRLRGFEFFPFPRVVSPPPTCG